MAAFPNKAAELRVMQPLCNLGMCLQLHLAFFLLVTATHRGSQGCARDTKIHPTALCRVVFAGLGDKEGPCGDFCFVLEEAQGRAED